MNGEIDIRSLLKNMTSQLNKGEHVFFTAYSLDKISQEDIIGLFRETKATTVILSRQTADRLHLTS